MAVSKSKPKSAARKATKSKSHGRKPVASNAIRPSLSQEEAMWRAQDDLRVLRMAEEVKADSSRLQKVAEVLAKEMQALKSVKLPRKAS